MVESIGKGSDLQILERTKNLGEEISIDYVAGIHYSFSIDCGAILRTLLKMVREENVMEIDDSELRTLALQSGSYKFWDDRCEDIYSIKDGEPV